MALADAKLAVERLFKLPAGTMNRFDEVNIWAKRQLALAPRGTRFGGNIYRHGKIIAVFQVPARPLRDDELFVWPGDFGPHKLRPKYLIARNPKTYGAEYE